MFRTEILIRVYWRDSRAYSLSSRRETIVRAWWSIFGARLILRSNRRRVFRFPARATPKHFPKLARSDFRSRPVLPNVLREPAFLWPEFRRDHKFPELVPAGATTIARLPRAS